MSESHRSTAGAVIGMIVSLLITGGAWTLVIVTAVTTNPDDIPKDTKDTVGFIFLVMIIAAVVSTLWTASLAHYLVTDEKIDFD